MRTALGLIVMMVTTSTATAQTVADQLQSQQLEAATVANAKAAGSVLEPLKATSGGMTEFVNPELTAEGSMVRLALYDKLADSLAKIAKPISTVFVVSGSNPPDTTHWIQFQAKRAAVKAAMRQANGMWSSVVGDGSWKLREADMCKTAAAKSSKSDGNQPMSILLSPAILGTTSLLGSILNLTQSTVKYTGANLTLNNSDPATLLYSKLSADKPLDGALSIDTGGETERAHLIAPLQEELSRLQPNLAHLNACLGAAGGEQAKLDSKLAAAGTAIKAAEAAYRALDDSLTQDVNGQSLATVIRREEAYATATTDRKIIYILSHQVAMTVITKRSAFSGFGDRSTIGAYGTMFYAIVDMPAHSDNVIPAPKPVIRGVITCNLAATKLKEVLPSIDKQVACPEFPVPPPMP